MKYIFCSLFTSLILSCNQGPPPIVVSNVKRDPTDDNKMRKMSGSQQVNRIDEEYRRQGPWVIIFRDTSKHGTLVMGLKYEEGCYIDGLKEGIWTYYKPDGSIDCKIEFKDDKPLLPKD